MTAIDADPERALLGEILNRPKSLHDVEGLDAADFAQPRYGALWDLMQWLDSKRIAPDLLAVHEHLHRIEMPNLDASWLASIAAAAQTWQPSGVLARMIQERAVRRRLVEAGSRIVQLAEAGGDPQEIQEQARGEIDAASRSVAEVTFVDQEIDETLQSWESPAPPSIPTPWTHLDEFIGGWRPGAMYIIAARPSVGKSLMGLQAALGLAEHGATAFHSLEMPKSEVHTRLISQMSLVPQARIDRREMTAGDWQKVMEARSRLAALPLSVDDRGTLRTVDIRAHARSMARRRPLGGIVVDYIGLMTPSRGDKRPRREQIGEWSRGLKLLAKEMHVPVLVLAQLNREAVNSRPTMAHLKESGDLEQDADVVLLLHEDTDPENPDLEVILDKNRQGQRGSIILTKRGHLARIDTPGQAPWTPSRAASRAAS